MMHVHRVDCEAATQRVVVRVGGEVVAESTRPVLLHETGLPTRYYLPREDVRTELLEPSAHRSTCPFKGEASYWTVHVDGRTAENAAWSYEDPIDGVAAIRGMLCFYPDRVELEVDETT